MQCKQELDNIRDYLTGKGKIPFDVIKRHIKSKDWRSFTPSEFKSLLEDELPPNMMQKLERDKRAKLGLLVHYLQREEWGRVSIEKLQQALARSSKQGPLPQDRQEEIRDYLEKLHGSLHDATEQEVPISVHHLCAFIFRENLSVHQIFGFSHNTTIKESNVINAQEFIDRLEKSFYKAPDKDSENRLIADLEPDVSRQRGARASQVSLYKLQRYYKMAYNKDNVQGRNLKYARFSPQIKEKLQKISQHLKKTNMSSQSLHEQLDQNKDGTVDSKEFVEGMKFLGIVGLSMKDYLHIFEEIDRDGNKFLSLNEFTTYLEGA